MHFGWITKTSVLTTLFLSVVALSLMLGLLRFHDHLVRVVFLSVGQGDAILIQSGHQQILIDGGREGAVLLSALGRVMPFYDRTIEVVIATHADADHIGGLPALLERYTVGQFIDTGVLRDTTDAELLNRALTRYQVKRDVPGRTGVTFTLARGGTLEILYPFNLPLPATLDSNDGSIVTRFEFGETSFLLTGDLPNEEYYLSQAKPAEVLKAAHHGSQYSTSDAWLDLIRPREVVLSVGKNNYGHPAPEVLERLERRGISTWRTDTDGSISYRCLPRDNQCYREE